MKLFISKLFITSIEYIGETIDWIDENTDRYHWLLVMVILLTWGWSVLASAIAGVLLVLFAANLYTKAEDYVGSVINRSPGDDRSSALDGDLPNELE